MEAAITALLASVAGGRRYWGRAPQSVTPDDGPYIVLTRIDGVRDYHMQGASGYVASRVQIDIYALTYTAVRDTVISVRNALSGFIGESSSTDIQGIFIDSQRDLPAPDAGEVNHLFRTSIDIIVHHKET